MRSLDLVGRQIGEFLVQEPIGHGGMAEVYRAHQPSISRDVALKVIRLNQTLDDDAFPRRFAQEASVIASLEHIHILPIYGYGINEDFAFLAMRLLVGGTLSDLLKLGPMSLERVVELFGQFASGLGYAHSKGVVHRDLKPSNIMMDDAGHAYLTDFGLAKIIGGEQDLTKTGNIVGTPAYMSPEQLRGDPLDHRSDIYSLGVVLYHMLTGRQPFEASNSDLVSVIYKHLEKAPVPPSQIKPEIPAEVEAVVLKAMAKKPEDRYASATDMARALRLAMGYTGSTTDYYTPQTPRPAATTGEITQEKKAQPPVTKYWPVAMLAALLVMTVAVIFVLNRPSQPAVINPLVGEGVVGKSSEIVPTEDELNTAQQVLGDNGFIAFVACNQTSEYHTGQGREMRDFFTEYGIAYQIYDSNNDKGMQLTQIEKARADGATGLIICALDNEVLHDSMMSIDAANLPLVIFNPGTENYGGVLLAGDDYLMGLKAGELAGQIIRDEMEGQAKVIILDYPDLPAIVIRADGLEAGIIANAPEAEIVGRYKGAIRDLGKASVSQLLADGVEFNVIASINDAGSFGAIDALVEARIDPADVVITSVDAEALARQYIRDGYFIRGSVDVGRTEFSQAAVNAMVNLLAGDTVPETILVPPGDVITKDDLE